MNKVKVLGAFATLALVAACGAPQGSSSQAVANKVDVAFTSEAARSGLLGFQPTEVRIKKLDPSGTTINDVDEINANCALTGQGYAATFTTPATVNVPNYGRRSKPIALACDYGDKNLERTYKIVNFSENQRKAKSSNVVTGLILLNPGLIVGGAAAKVKTAEDGSDIYGYNDISITVN